MGANIKKDIYSRTIEYGLIALVLLVPIVFMHAIHPELPKVVLAEIIIWTLAVVWLFRCIERRDFSATSTPMNKPMLAFVAAATLSFIFSRYPSIAMIDTTKFASYVLLFFLVVNFINNGKKLHVFLNMMIIAASAACAYGFLQRYSFSWVFPMLLNAATLLNRTTSTFLNPNFFAAFLIMVLPVAVYLYFRAEKYAGSLAYLIIIIMMLTSLLCTFTRAAWVSCIASFVFFGLADFKYFLKKKWKIIILSLILLIVVLLTVTERFNFCPVHYQTTTKEDLAGGIAGSSNETLLKKIIRTQIIGGENQTSTKDDVSQRIMASSQETHLEKVVQTRVLGEEKSISNLENKTLYYSVFDEQRRLYYGVARRIFADHIAVGSGPGTFGFIIPDYLQVKSIPDIYYKPKIVHAHNEYLEIMAEMGFVGIAAFAWLLLAFFFSCHSIITRSKGENRNFVIALAAGVIAILLHSIFDVGLRYPSITIFFWIFMGLVFASENANRPDAGKLGQKGRKKFRPLFILFILAIFAVFSAIGARVLLSEVYMSNNPSTYALQRAIELNPYSTDPYLMLAVKAKSNNDPIMMIKALKGLDALVPGYFAASYSLGIAYYQIGDYDNAIAQLDKVKDKGLVEKWLIFAQYRKEHNMKPWETVNATIYING